MSAINDLAVLNTIADNGADAYVNSLGNVSLTGLAPFKARNIIPGGVKRISSQTEQKKKQIVTFTAANSYTYSFVIQGYVNTSDTNSPIKKEALITFTSDATATADEVSALATAAVNAVGGFSVTATDQGSASGAILLAAAAGYPDFVVLEDDSNIAVTAVLTVSFAAPTASGGITAQGFAVVADAGTVSSILITNPGSGYSAAPTVTFAGGSGSAAAGTAVIKNGQVLSVTVTNAGSAYTGRVAIEAVGTVAKLQYKYGGTTQGGGVASKPELPGLSDLTSGSTYTAWEISFLDYTDQPAYAFPVNKLTYVFLVNNVPTAGGSDPVLISLALLQDPVYGSLSLLQQGYRSNVTPSSTTQALITVTTGVVTLDGGSQTFSTLGAQPGDFLVISQAGGTAFGTTLYTTKIQSIGATQLLGIGDNIVALPATSEDFKYIAVRTLPY